MTIKKNKNMFIPNLGIFGEHDVPTNTLFMHCETLTYRTKRHLLDFEPHRHSHIFQLFYLKNGEVNATLEHDVVTINGPTLLSLPAKSVHGFNYNNSVEGYIFSFGQDFVYASFAPMVKGIEQLFTQIHLIDHEKMTDISAFLSAHLDALFYEINNVKFGQTEVVMSLLKTILIWLYRSQTNHPIVLSELKQKQSQNELFQRFIKLVEIHYQEQWSISQYCDYLGTNERNLHRKCHQVIGMSGSKYLQNRLIQEAKRLLQHTSLNITQIAYELGFKDSSYFSRYFKRQTGINPKLFIDSIPVLLKNSGTNNSNN